MNAALLRVLALACRPLRSVDARLPLLEVLLDCRLPGSEVDALRRLPPGHGALGRFYHWKLEQLAAVAAVESRSRDRILALIGRHDRTDYTPLDAALQGGGGLLAAIPHHGHFVFAIVALCERIAASRPVFVFYESPESHATNAVFDLLNQRLFGDGRRGVRILHNTRQGLARAMKALRAGALVVIMPDVFRDVHDSYQLPFCGGQRNVMLGTATIARRTDARILPMVARTTGRVLDFSTTFAGPIVPAVGEGGRHDETHADFRTTHALFQAFEPLMRDQLIHWQYARGHRAAAGAGFGRDAIATVGPMLLRDPRVSVDLSQPIHLD